jgi:diguanylate cyclase (GGDEF)-like protein
MDSSLLTLPSIDIATLAVARAIIQMTLAGLIIWMGSRQEQRGGAPWWALGLLAHGFALLVFTISYTPLDTLIIAINHLGFGLSSAFILIGFWQFGQLPVRRWLVVLIVSIPAVSLVLWEIWLPNARFRILTTASGQFVFLLALQAILMHAPRLEMAGIYRALRWIVIAYAAVLLWSYASLIDLLPTTARVPPGYHGILFSVSSMLFMLSLAVSFLALQYAQIACQHSDQARRDWLTGLLNRRGFLEAFESRDLDHDRAARYTVLTIDVDHFKSINDRFGHALGDRVLEVLASVLGQHAGSDDLVARMGGEEFLFLRADLDQAKAAALADDIRLSCAESVSQPLAPGIKISVSIGVALRYPDELLDDVLRRADAALYQAKASGRNCIAIAPLAPAAG